MGKRKKTTGPCHRHCALCGRLIFSHEADFITGSTGRVACRNCLNVSQRIPESRQTSAKQPETTGAVILTPQALIRKLDESIIGQERAKRAVAVALWKQQLRAAGDRDIPRTNLLLFGPTGCGKTALVREAAALAGLPFISFDATTLSETGYRGRYARDMVKDLMDRFEGHPKLSSGVVFVDEIDKLAARGSDTRTEYNRGTQHSLLKLVEGVDVSDGATTVSTSGLLFIFGGAFTGLAAPPMNQTRPIGFRKEPSAPAAEDPSPRISVSAFVRFGMEPELMGRVGQYVPVDPLTKEELKRILTESTLSLYPQYQRFFSFHGVRLEFSEEFMDELVENAAKRGTGARGLNNLVEEAVEPMLFQLASGQLDPHMQERSEPFLNRAGVWGNPQSSKQS